MDSLYILIPIALCFVALAVKAFFWAVDNKQYDDLDAAAHSILFEEEVPPVKPPVKQGLGTESDDTDD
ncbi:cbb3-type cytochrome oxidase assembly protein CcoS [Oceanicoccus sp. KOV_DT_Chl]|uniref:cbb3-type cytochrome oxidase assembly protein CcoS n=1 Tax=Oceanicoccus sp. KOV_DT_Chl TaxID=1904639 RepID=UPI000C7DC984|nr:cbb3-type cytochrome oxidase assembly protein CcoS [Oceanicoccus sp. KOV_DT_Chl]